VDAVPVLGGWQDESPGRHGVRQQGVCVVSTTNRQSSVEQPSRSGTETRGFQATRRQVIFREVNERIEPLGEEFDEQFGHTGTVSLLCECGNSGCFERVEITPADYEAARGFPTRFLVKPGHVAREGERVIRETSACVIVEKTGQSASDAVRFDPRLPSRRNGGHEPMSVTEAAPTATQAETRSAPVKLVFFYSKRSGRSRRAEGFLAQVLQRRRNHHTFKLLRVDVDERPDLAQRFRVTTIPTLAVIANNRVQARLTQPRGSREISKLLSPWLK
jgi:hypothetical protein